MLLKGVQRTQIRSERAEAGCGYRASIDMGYTWMWIMSCGFRCRAGWYVCKVPVKVEAEVGECGPGGTSKLSVRRWRRGGCGHAQTQSTHEPQIERQCASVWNGGVGCATGMCRCRVRSRRNLQWATATQFVRAIDGPCDTNKALGSRFERVQTPETSAGLKSRSAWFQASTSRCTWASATRERQGDVGNCRECR